MANVPEEPTGYGVKQALEALKWTWENRGWIRDKLNEIRRWFAGTDGDADSPRGVLILGPGGVGKSTVGQLLAGSYESILDVPGEYVESLNLESYALKDNPEISVVVPPGQETRRDWDGILADVAGGVYRGIIFLTAYGYHSIGDFSYRNHRLFEGDVDAFVDAYIEDRRREEIEVIQRLTAQAAVCRDRCWILSFVNKQDLWWPLHDQVENHYRSGEYANAIASVTQRRAKREFRHEIVLGSLVISNFCTGRGELLRMTAAGYDQRLQTASLRKFIETLDAIKTWEQENVG